MAIKDKLIQHLKLIDADILTHKEVSGRMGKKEKFYHKGKEDEAEGLKVDFLTLFREEMI